MKKLKHIKPNKEYEYAEYLDNQNENIQETEIHKKI